MITLYGMPSPNVLKILLMLEEAGLPYELKHVAVLRGEGQAPWLRALNPFGKVPVIIDRVDSEERVFFESGAILIYLAETYAPALLPQSGPARWRTLEWVAAQVAYAGPMLGQMNHFQLVPSEGNSYAAARYRDQAQLVYRHFDDRLAQAPWLGGEQYSIADIAMHPWSAYLARHGFDAADFPHLTAWSARIDQRPAWGRAHAAIPTLVGDPTMSASDAEMDIFFGRSQPGPPSDMASYAALGPMIRPGA
jgi:GST-like protein